MVLNLKRFQALPTLTVCNYMGGGGPECHPLHEIKHLEVHQEIFIMHCRSSAFLVKLVSKRATQIEMKMSKYF